MRTLLRWLMIGLVVLCGMPAVPTRAQNTLALNALTIELWPEYDQPSMLVILRGTLAPSVELPASVTVRIPASSGGPSAVATQDADGNLLNAQFVTTPLSDTLAVTLQATTASFQVEYYDSALTIDGKTRSFDFAWAADFPVATATLRIQEPVDTSSLSATPPVTLAGTSDLGLDYYTASLGALAAGQSVIVHVQYTKSTSTLSATKITPVAEVTPILATPTSSPSLLSEATLRYGLAALSGLLSVGLLVWGVVIWRRGRAGALPPNVGRRVGGKTAKPLPTSTLLSASGTAPFCIQCGARTSASDRFCRNCGTALHPEPAES